MKLRQVVPDVYQVQLGIVNAFIIREGDGSATLIDTGYPNSQEPILQALQQLGHPPTDVRQIVITHCHPDHSGSLAAVRKLTGARTYMHPADAELVRRGQAARPLTPSPGLMSGLLYRTFVSRAPTHVEPCEIDVEIHDGELLPFGGGLRVIYAPGQSAGQVALLRPQDGGLLFVADAASNMPYLQLSICYEDHQVGRDTLRRLAELPFRVACFGHGPPLLEQAADALRALALTVASD